MSDKPETARECANSLVHRWLSTTSELRRSAILTHISVPALTDAITSALEEREREIARVNTEWINAVARSNTALLTAAGVEHALKEKCDTLREQLEERERKLEAWRTDAGKSHFECDNLKWERDNLNEQLAEAVSIIGSYVADDLSMREAGKQFLARVKGSTKSDPIKDLCDLLKENNMGFVFWVCDNPEHRRVTWEHRKEGSVATCDACGKKSSLIQTGPSALREVPPTLWDSINKYAESVGGRPDRHIYGNVTRQRLVVEIENLIKGNDQLKAEREEARRVIEPLAKVAEEADRQDDSDTPSWRDSLSLRHFNHSLNLGHCRAAKAWLDANPKEKSNG